MCDKHEPFEEEEEVQIYGDDALDEQSPQDPKSSKRPPRTTGAMLGVLTKTPLNMDFFSPPFKKVKTKSILHGGSNGQD